LSIITLISVLSPLIPILVGYKKRYTLLWFYALTGLFFNLLISQLPAIYGAIKGITANIFVCAEFLFFIAFYKRQFGGKKNQWLALVSLVAVTFILLAIYNGYFKFNAIGSAIFCFIYICFALWGFMSFIRRTNTLHLTSSSFFIANAAILIYASSVFLVFLTGFIFQDIYLKIQLWHWVVEPMNAFKYILIGIALTRKNL
jgi:hypothetical protein